jgi:predicted amidohydrolase YtcJ
VTSPDRVNELARKPEHGWQLWVTPSETAATAWRLDAFAAAAAAQPDAPPWESARASSTRRSLRDDIRDLAGRGHRFIQPTHATSDMLLASARRAERIAGAYAWRMLKSAGARLAGGSDFPVESENPLLGFYMR